MIIQKMFKYRIYPSTKQRVRLLTNFKISKEIYNLLLIENKKYYFNQKFDFNSIIKDIKITNEERYSKVHSQVLQNISDRVSKAFENFFNRIKMRQAGIKIKAGFPRFKSRIQSITYSQSGFKLDGNKIQLSKIGRMPIILSREIEGKIKTLTIKKNKSHEWYAVFSVQIEKEEPIHPSNKSVGIDVGLERYATLSKQDGIIENPRFFRKSEKDLYTAQRTLSRRKKGSQNWKKQKIKVAKIHKKITNQRTDFLHKTTAFLAKKYCLIKVENLKIQNMLKNHCLAKSISDAGWGKFFSMLAYKEVVLGGKFEKNNPRNTSKKCSKCGTLVDMPLFKRTFTCPKCRHTTHRDDNASDNILQNDTEGHSGISTPVDIAPLFQRLAGVSAIVEAGTISGVAI
jgi:putative transposase